MNLEQIRTRRGEVLAELKAIAASSQLAKRQFTDDERARVTALMAEDATLKTQQESIEAEEQARLAIAAMDAEANASTGRLASADSGSERLIPATVKRPAFACLGEQLQAIAQVGITGREDNRLRWENLAPATGAAVASIPSDGGYLIEKDFVTDLTQRMYEQGRFLSLIRRVGIGPNSDGLKLNVINETSRATGSRWGGVQVYWGAEADSATAKKPKLRQMELELKDLIGLAYMTNRLLADASAMQAVFTTAFAEEMAFVVEDALINGTGAGQPLGVLNAGAVVSIAKETGQAANTILYENVKKMWARLWARSRGNAVWIHNQDCEPELQSMAFPIGVGGVPVFLPPGGISQASYSTLFGRPMIPLEYCATLGTTGDLMLVDPTQIVMIEKGGLQADTSIHVRFITNELTLRWIYRVDAQPLWNSALTPYKGTGNTVSPFVKLDTRA